MSQRNEQAVQIAIAKEKNIPLRAWLLEFPIDGWKNVAISATEGGAFRIANAARPHLEVKVSPLPALAIPYPEFEPA